MRFEAWLEKQMSAAYNTGIGRGGNVELDDGRDLLRERRIDLVRCVCLRPRWLPRTTQIRVRRVGW
jgi:hypothetical protein